MSIYSKGSLQDLKTKVDLVDLISSHVELKKSGASYKGLCPFHDERSSSFMIQKGDSHYHCFGCGAHGDAIQFLMAHLKLNFSEAVESLAQRFGVTLEKIESHEERKGSNKTALKESLETSCQCFQSFLLYTQEGHLALQYLYRRGITLDFIHRFRIGLAPKESGMLRKLLHAKFISNEVMEEAGLIVLKEDGKWRDFFLDRIMFPICDPTGAIIGFSARKYKEETFGGKYINTSETPLFKKSRVLFGLHHSRKRIAKERKAIIVEGQIDALRLIASGFDITVAGQGTAFGEGHVQELLNLGVNEVYLALDNDDAGMQATVKIGQFFQKEGVEVKIIQLPRGSDPDLFLREQGPDQFLNRMKSSIDYISFLVNHLSQKLDVNSPAGKNELVQLVTQQIRSWNHSLMVHESLRKVAYLLKVPESMLGVGQDFVPNIYVKQSSSIGIQTIDPDQILESDFLRWFLVIGRSKSDAITLVLQHISGEQLHHPLCRSVYEACLNGYQPGQGFDFIRIISQLESKEEQVLFNELSHQKVKGESRQEPLLEIAQKILDRNWMQQREEIRSQIVSGQHSDDEAIELSKKFNDLKKTILQI